MKKEKIKRIIKHLKELPDTEINMFSMLEPTCGTPGCFAGLLYLIIQKIPELNKIYTKHRISYDYEYEEIGHAFAIYIGFKNINDLDTWIIKNPEIWSTGHKCEIFKDPEAWEQDSNIFSSQIIINKLESVYSRL